MAKIGTVTDVMKKYGLPDGAAAWRYILDNNLKHVQGEDPEKPDRWTIYDEKED